MTSKEKFSQEEWNELQCAVVWMFTAIAGADGRIDDDEVNAMQSIAQKSDRFDNQLIADVINALRNDIQTIFRDVESEHGNAREGLRAVAKILDTKLPANESLEFKKALLAVGTFIANASGSLLDISISNEEYQTLVELSLYMRISKAQMKEEPTVQTILDKLTHH